MSVSEGAKSELFKSKYKFIEFQKKGPVHNVPEKSSTSKPITEPGIKEFYSELISSEPCLEHAPRSRKSAPKQKQRISKSQSIPSQSHYLTACQNDELSAVKDFLGKCPSALNTRDQFGWNGLMIAIAANSQHVLNFFFSHQTRNKLFKDFLNNEDTTGTETARSIAHKSKNKRALDLIDSWYLNANKEPDVIILDDEEEDQRCIIIIIICDLNNHGLYRSKDFFISQI